jgi:hypothetical protein
MLGHDTNARSVTRRLGALALALWLGGFGCLLGCEPMASAAGVEHMAHAPDAAESHAAMNHGCCHHAKKDARAESTSVEANARADVGQSSCPFSTPATESSRKVGVKSAAATVAHGALPTVALASTSFDSPHGRARPPDRGGTYLRCCVFLI